MKETEITIEVFDTLDQINRILKEKGFIVERKYDLIDYYYSKYSIVELNKFNYKELINNSFLVRQFVDDSPTSSIIFKNKDLDNLGNVIREEKVKCGIKDLDNALRIFNLAGLNCWCTLNQHVLIYKKDSIEFAVQIVDDLGIFIEYEEDDTMFNMSEQEKIDLMFNALQGLGLKLGKDYSCKKVYLKFKKQLKQQI